MQGCAQEHFGVTPDLTCMGKVIGGGLPVGAYGGKKEIMSMVSPAGVCIMVCACTQGCAELCKY
jgi:glutamate-1-semialdehyde aminotransferase